ncbi:hypothetical protein CsSME_00032675 [Camellia sinensis var. sinensis]
MGLKITREGVLSAFDYLLKGRKVKLNADQRKKTVLNYCVESKEDESTVDMEIAEIEEDRGLNKYLKIISTMVIQVTTVEYAYKAFRIFRILTKDPKAVFWTKNHHHQMGEKNY